MLKRERAAWGEEVEVCGKWAKGVWLGRSWNSNESIVATAHGISRSRAVRILPGQASWRSDLVEKVTVQPWGEQLAQEVVEDVTFEFDPNALPQ